MKNLPTELCLILILKSACGSVSRSSSISGRTSDDQSYKLYMDFNVNSPDSMGISDTDVKNKLNTFIFSLTNLSDLCSESNNIVVSGQIGEGGKKMVLADNRCEYRALLTYKYDPDQVAPNASDATGTVPDGQSPIDVNPSNSEDPAEFPSTDREGGNLAPTYTGYMKNLIDTNCATVGCHVTGSISPDLSTYAGVLASFQSEVPASNSYLRMLGQDAMGQAFALPMPVSGLLGSEIMAQVKAWIDGGYLEEQPAGAALSNPENAVTLYESVPMVLPARMLDGRKKLTLSFELHLTPEGEAEGLDSQKIRSGFAP